MSIGDEVEGSLRTLYQLIRTQSNRVAREAGLTWPQVLLLKKIARHGEASLGELAKASHLSQATITGIVDRLEHRDLIQKRRGRSDRRRILVKLTPAANRMLKNHPELLRAHFADAFKTLPRSEQQGILKSLQRLETLMEDRPAK